MKKITINGFELAMSAVGNALHVTVKSVHSKRSVTLEDFRKDNQPALIIYNEFSARFKTLPTEWHERLVGSSEVAYNIDKRKQILIIIIK